MKKRLSEIEQGFGQHKNNGWKTVILFVENLLLEYPNDVEVSIRVIYLLHNILVEERYSDDEHNMIAGLLKELFDKSYIQFSENAEYLFFIGKILHIAEWYFGLDNCNLALACQKKAMEKEPHNLLYEWAYRFSVSDPNEGYLANQLVENKDESIKYLEEKGFPGFYVLEHLKMSNESYLKQAKRTNLKT